MSTRRNTLAIALVALFLATSILNADDKAQDKEAKNPLASLERFLGEWTVEGKWSDGNELHARAVYEWGVGKKIITAKTFVKPLKDKEYQRYESILTYHPKKKSLYEITFAFDGTISEVLLDQQDEDTLHIGYTPFTDGEEGKVRQVIRFKDKNTFTWIAELKSDKGWTKLIEADWKRKEKK
jgi:hypothetical protein